MPDQGSWFPSWEVPRNDTDDDLILHPSLAYMFQTADVLKSNPYWGKMNWYTGGGFVASLGNSLKVKN